MNKEIKIIIAQNLHRLFLAKGKNPPSDEMLRLWVEYLHSYTPVEIATAFEKEIRSNNDFPTLGRILNGIDPLPDPESESLDAWNELLNDISAGHERYTDEQMDICREVAGSVTEIRQANEFGLSTIKKEYIRVYSKKVQKKIAEKIQIQTKHNTLIGKNHG